MGLFCEGETEKGRRKRGDYFSKDIYFKYASFTFGSDTVSEKALVHSKYNVWWVENTIRVLLQENTGCRRVIRGGLFGGFHMK